MMFNTVRFGATTPPVKPQVKFSHVFSPQFYETWEQSWGPRPEATLRNIPGLGERYTNNLNEKRGGRHDDQAVAIINGTLSEEEASKVIKTLKKYTDQGIPHPMAPTQYTRGDGTRYNPNY